MTKGPFPLPFVPRMMRAREAAPYIGVSVHTLRELPIPARRPRPGIVLYDRLDLDAWADSLAEQGDRGGWGA